MAVDLIKIVEMNGRTETRENITSADHEKIKHGFLFLACSCKRYNERRYDYLGVYRGYYEKGEYFPSHS